MKTIISYTFIHIPYMWKIDLSCNLILPIQLIKINKTYNEKFKRKQTKKQNIPEIKLNINDEYPIIRLLSFKNQLFSVKNMRKLLLSFSHQMLK